MENLILTIHFIDDLYDSIIINPNKEFFFISKYWCNLLCLFITFNVYADSRSSTHKYRMYHNLLRSVVVKKETDMLWSDIFLFVSRQLLQQLSTGLTQVASLDRLVEGKIDFLPRSHFKWDH